MVGSIRKYINRTSPCQTLLMCGNTFLGKNATMASGLWLTFQILQMSVKSKSQEAIFGFVFFLIDSVSIGPSQTFLAVMPHHTVIFSKFQILSLEEILNNKMKTNVWRHVGQLHHHQDRSCALIRRRVS